jgi:hypothetical protein
MGMAGDDVRQVFEALLPQGEIECSYVQFGMIKRQRKLNLDRLVQAWIISADTPSVAYQTNVLRSSVEFEVPRVTCSAFYRWFDEPLERLMEARGDPPLKSAPRFDQVDAESPFSMITLLHASLVASIITALLTHAYRLIFPYPVGSIRGRTSQIRVFSQC